MNTQNAMKHYKSIGLKSDIESANAHRLTGMLFTGAVTKISEAKAAMAGGQIALKGEALSKAIAIVEYLRASLDLGIDAGFAERLAVLYQYIERRLLDANIQNDELALDEVQDLLRELSEGWSGIPKEYRN
jgi:flagellar secretion chaperone FliS